MFKTIKYMKTTKFLLFLILIVISTKSIYAQNRVALNHQGTTSIFGGANPLTDAYNAAQDGDTIYIPGGLFGIPNIQKKICLIGTGYFTDSLNATGMTIINGLSINAGATGTVITGIRINGNIAIDGNAIIDSLFIFRNHITGDIYYPGGNFNKPDSLKSKDVLIAENRVYNINCDNVSNIKVFNNIALSVGNSKNGWIRNNVLLGSYGVFGYLNECLIENNYLTSISWWPVNNNTFLNNIMNFDPSSNLTNTFINNYINLPMQNVFVNYVNNSPFNFLNNFHLQNPAAYPANNASEVGIFGGYYPFKDSGLPLNPHISTKNIATQTNVNGDLNIQIEVNAQNN